MDWSEIIRIIALVLILEGILPLLFPNRWCRMAEMLAAISPSKIRLSGAITMLIGAALLLLDT